MCEHLHRLQRNPKFLLHGVCACEQGFTISSNLTKDPVHKDMERSVFPCYAARSHLHVPFSLYSHSFKLGNLHCSLINVICQNYF